jgi:(p)ppGpp synthase/HD superfamily hydrolase
MKRISITKLAAYRAISLHGAQDYDGKPYFYHLEQVVDVLKEFGFTDDKYVVAGYLHDTLEDTAVSYKDIEKEFGKDVAEIVYCVTDELGRDRKERKAKTYPKIRSNPDAIVVKLADRIANMRSSKINQKGLSKMYQKEMDTFKKELYDEDQIEAAPMWLELFELTLEQGIEEIKHGR